MAHVKEIHKERVIYKENGQPAETIRETHVVDDVPGEHGHVYHDHAHSDDRHDYRTRRDVRREIVGFRRGTYLILDIVEIILILAFFVKLFGFNPLNPVVALIDMLSYPLYAPFAGFMTAVTPYFVINWSILIAMVVYALIAYILIALFAASVRAGYRTK